MTYVEIDMPKTEDKKWFLKRREKYFVHRNIHHYPQLERLKAWRVEKSRGVAALVPVSLVDDKVRRPKEGGKETLIDWYSTNVKSKLVSLKRRQRRLQKKKLLQPSSSEGTTTT